MDKKALQINQELEIRLSALAEQSGLSVIEFVEDILLTHVQEQEQLRAEFKEDDERWQRYLDTGNFLSASDVKSKLRSLATQAAKKADAE